MGKFYIEAKYEYAGEVEADNAEQAYELFIDDLDTYYVGTYDYEIDEMEEEE